MKTVFIPDSIMRNKKLTPTSKLVFAKLLQYTVDKQEFPSIEVIAEEVGSNEKTVRRCIEQLEKEGFIRVIKPTGNDKLLHKPNRYEILRSFD